MFATILKAFRPLDTTEAHAAFADAAKAQRDVAVRARALRMDISCGDPAAVMERIAARVLGSAGHILRVVYEPTVQEPTPVGMQRLLDDI